MLRGYVYERTCMRLKLEMTFCIAMAAHGILLGKNLTSDTQTNGPVCQLKQAEDSPNKMQSCRPRTSGPWYIRV